jgi:hypothetical protein
LETISKAVQAGDDTIQDVGTRVLGEWMTADVAPALLEIATNPATDKYHVRALRGYLRVARQAVMSPSERLEMCRNALEIATRPDERNLVIDALKRSPSIESLELAASLINEEGSKDAAIEAVVSIGERLKNAARLAGSQALEAEPPAELEERVHALTAP